MKTNKGTRETLLRFKGLLYENKTVLPKPEVGAEDEGAWAKVRRRPEAGAEDEGAWAKVAEVRGRCGR